MDVSGIAYWVRAGRAARHRRGDLARGLPAPSTRSGRRTSRRRRTRARRAVIAAYLPNEAATIVETVEAFLRRRLPRRRCRSWSPTTRPSPMAVEDELRAMAQTDPRIVPLKVEDSTSKAQNVNAAMSHVTGEFVGMFDADHHPEPGAFERAWRWLSNGYDVVQGHCVIRNGDASLVAQTGRGRVRVDLRRQPPRPRRRCTASASSAAPTATGAPSLLAETRMHGSMLTEDIDSTLRVLAAGAEDRLRPGAGLPRAGPRPPSSALWKQRARWAQGWFQVSRKHLRLHLRSPHLTPAPEGGLAFLLGWREIYPWLSLQIFPVLGLHRLPRRRHRPAQLAGARAAADHAVHARRRARRRRCSPGGSRSPRSGSAPRGSGATCWCPRSSTPSGRTSSPGRPAQGAARGAQWNVTPRTRPTPPRPPEVSA